MGTTMTTLLQIGCLLTVLISYTNGFSCAWWFGGPIPPPCKANEWSGPCGGCNPRYQEGEYCRVNFSNKCALGLECVSTGKVTREMVGFAPDVIEMKVEHGKCGNPKKQKNNYQWKQMNE